MFISIVTGAVIDPYPAPDDSTPRPLLFGISFNIIIRYTLAYSKQSLSSDLRTKIMYTFLSHACWMPLKPLQLKMMDLQWGKPALPTVSKGADESQLINLNFQL
jgi:hypothetical protein